MVDLAKLNAPQREAASHGGGPLLVLAGAGSGKTRVITFRIAHLIDLGIPPSAICAVTFTNKAAEEMRERVAAILRDKQATRELTIGTFHALGLSILRQERKALGLPRGFAIYDQSDQMGALREALRHTKQMTRDGERRFDVKAILTRISLAKNAFIAPDQYEGNPADDYDAMTVEVYPKYQEMLRACAAFDFDDLIVEPVRLFETNPDVRARWANKYRFVMVDEFQDTNAAQLRMVRALVEQHQNLCVVGDDDQSIYSWRGADPTNILSFGELFPGAKIVKLEQNYRSTKTILEAANTVIANNKQRHGKTLWSQIGNGAMITHAVAPTPEDEAKWIAQEIHELNKSGRPWDSIAVMYRSNIQAKILEEELRTASIPYVMYGGQQFFERKEVKDLIAYLRVALNPKDELALRRIINYPARGIGATTVERLVLAAQAKHATLWDAMKGAVTGTATLPGMDVMLSTNDDDPLGATPHVEVGEVRGATKNGILELIHVVSELGATIEAGENIVSATKVLIEDIKLYDDLRHASGSMSAAQRRIDNVEGLLRSLERFAEKGKGREQLAEYLRMLSLESKDEEQDTRAKVVLTTLHGSKGLEFPVCFMIGLEEELLPHIRTLQPQATDVLDADHATDISEERRLCYVGITRAQQKLYLTRACTRVARGRSVPRTPSRFLLEIPEDLFEVIDIAEFQRQKVPTAEVQSFFGNLASMLDD
ncbi:MAG: ATP-dependent helicase [Kofleriaceae bacterium]